MTKYNILILGAAYGLLPAVRLLKTGHSVTVVCREVEQDALAKAGATLIFGEGGVAERHLKADAAYGPSLGGKLGLVGTDCPIDDYDIVFLAMAEPHYMASDVSQLMGRIAKARLPIVSLMNMPPPAMLRRIAGPLNVDNLAAAYSAWDVWEKFDPDLVSAASPDAQAVRTDPARFDTLTVTLGSNFKVAPFVRAQDQQILTTLESDVAAHRIDDVALPVRIIAHSQVHIPLAKWPMLVAGNCRCLNADGTLISIFEAVHSDLKQSEAIYDTTLNIVKKVSKSEEGFVPFKAYARAAKRLSRPSSFARAIASGAPNVERVDKLVYLAAKSLGHQFSELDQIVALVDAKLAENQMRSN